MSELCPPIAASLGDVTTERLVLRRFDRGAFEELALLFENREVWRFPYGRGLTRTETEDFLATQMQHWEEYGFGCWMARTRDDDVLIGYVGLSIPTFLPEILPAVEVGWRFAPTAWGNGYASEGATAALDEAFSTLGLESVCSLPQSENPRSERVAARLGMTLLRRVTVRANETRGDVVVSHFEITRTQWRSRESQSMN